MTRRIVRVLCSAILLALILVSLAFPLLYQTTALAEGGAVEECRGGYMTSSGRSCEAATLADGGTNGWWRDGEYQPA